MKNIRFHSVFLKLSSSEKRDFSALLCCDTFCRRKKLVELFQLYESTKDLDFEQFWIHLYPNEPFDRKRIHALFGVLYKLLLRFLAWNSLQENTELEAILGLQALRKMNAESAFESEAKRINKHLQTKAYKDDQVFFAQYLIANEEDYYLTQRQIRKQTTPLQRRINALDNFYLGTKFALSAEALSRNQIIGEAYQSSWTEPLGQLFDDDPAAHMDILWLQIQRQLLRCLEEPKEVEHYHHFVELLRQHQNSLSHDAKRYLYKSAQNYCIRRINSGDTRFQKAIFDLFQTMLDQGLLINEQGHIAHSDVKNIVTVALRQEAYTWTASFIEAFGPKVHDKHRDNVMSYCRALYDANTGKPQLAIRRLREVSFTDMLYDLSARRLLAQIFFEQEDWEGLSHHMNAFELFLRRQKQLSTHNRNSHLNFVRILKAIAKLSEQRNYRNDEVNNKRQSKLLLRIETTDSLAYREWLVGLLRN